MGADRLDMLLWELEEMARIGNAESLEELLDARSRFAFDPDVYPAIDVAVHRLRARLGEEYVHGVSR